MTEHSVNKMPLLVLHCLVRAGLEQRAKHPGFDEVVRRAKSENNEWE